MAALLVITNAAAGSADREAVDAAVRTLREGADAEVVATSTPEDCDAAVAGSLLNVELGEFTQGACRPTQVR